MSINQTIQHKRSTVTGNVPTAAQIAVGEIAINFADRSIYTKTPSNQIIELARDLVVDSTQPTGASSGDLWYNTLTDVLNVFNGSVWASVVTTGPNVSSANSTSANSTGGNGSISSPYLLSVTPLPGSTVLVDTITVTGLAPGQFVSIVDTNAINNGGRFTATNMVADTFGVLRTNILFVDLPTSASSTAYSASIRIGSSSVYLSITASIGSNPFPNTINSPTGVSSTSTLWTAPNDILTSTGDLLISLDGVTFGAGPLNITTGATLYLKWAGNPGSGTGIDSANGVTITGSVGTTGTAPSPNSLTIDKQPDAITFASQTGVSQSTVVTSNSVTITGVNSYVYLTSANTMTASVAGATFISVPASGTSLVAVNGQTLQVRQTSSASGSTTTTVTINANGVTAPFAVTTIAVGVSTPSITTPTAGATGISPTATIVASAYAVTGTVGTHLNSDWEIYNNSSLTGPTVASSLASTTNLTTWTPSGLSYLTQYWARVRYRSNDSTPFVSDWSPSRNWTTVQQPGVNWTYQPQLATTTWGAADAQAVEWTGSQYLLAGTGMRAATSSDGITWTYQAGLTTVYGSTVGSINAIVWNGSQYLAVGGGTSLLRLATSPDGITWDNRVSGLQSTAWGAEPARDVIWTGSQYVVVGRAGRLATSSDGINWTFRAGLNGASWSNADVWGVVWNGTQYLASGANGNIATSPDAVTWTFQAGLQSTAWGTSGNAMEVVWNGSQYLVAGTAGRVATSPDGITWTYQAGLSSGTWGATTVWKASWNGTQYLLVGSNSRVATSPDGVTWTYQPQLPTTTWGTSTPVYASVWTGSQYVIVGGTGRVATSP